MYHHVNMIIGFGALSHAAGDRFQGALDR